MSSWRLHGRLPTMTTWLKWLSDLKICMALKVLRFQYIDLRWSKNLCSLVFQAVILQGPCQTTVNYCTPQDHIVVQKQRDSQVPSHKKTSFQKFTMERANMTGQLVYAHEGFYLFLSLPTCLPVLEHQKSLLHQKDVYMMKATALAVKLCTCQLPTITLWSSLACWQISQKYGFPCQIAKLSQSLMFVLPSQLGTYSVHIQTE